MVAGERSVEEPLALTRGGAVHSRRAYLQFPDYFMRVAEQDAVSITTLTRDA
ncbi:MAG: hypothetical protein ACPHF4_11650 [Rubripirellula sp.]